MTIRHDCNKSGICYITTMPNWSFLDLLLPRKIKVGDGDGWVEMNGHLLLFEWKGLDVPLTYGQEIGFIRSSEMSPGVTWLALWGETSPETKPEVGQIYKDGVTGPEMRGFDIERCRAFVHMWGKWARGELSDFPYPEDTC